MSKISLPGRLQLDQVQGDWPSSREAVISALGDLQDAVVKTVNGELSMRDNTTSDYDKYLLTHGVQTRIKNPLRRGDKIRPVVGIEAYRCIGVEMANGKPTRKLYSLAVPRIDWEPADSSSSTLLVTATYPPPTGDLLVKRTTDQSLANNTATALQWSSVETQIGTGLSWASGSNTRITCGAAGRVASTHIVPWDTSAAGYRQAYVKKNGSGDYGDVFAVGGSFSGLCGTDAIDVVAGDYLEVFGLQTSGGNLNVIGSSNRAMHWVRYVAPPNGTTGNVTLLFFGG